MIVEEAKIEVIEAPNFFIPILQNNAEDSGIKENKIKIYTSSIFKSSKLKTEFFVTVNIIDDITINDKPDKTNKRPVILIGELFLTNFIVNKYEDAIQIAETIDSKSPKLKQLIDDPTLLPIDIVMKNPMIARKTPNNCVFVNRSFNTKCAKNRTIVISRAPAIRPSFEAPILLTESYHVKIPTDKNIAAGNNCL